MTVFCANCRISKRIRKFGKIFGRLSTIYPQFLLKTLTPFFLLRLPFLEPKQAHYFKETVPFDGVRNERKDENNDHQTG